MGCFYGGGHPVEIDPRLWERCRRQVAAAMVAEGWKPYARKFDDVRDRKARRLFWERRA